MRGSSSRGPRPRSGTETGPEIPSLDADAVQLLAEALHEGHAGTATWQQAWRNVRRLLLVCKTWNEGTERWLISHVNFTRDMTFFSSLIEQSPRPTNPHTRSAQHSLDAARELLSKNPYETAARLLLRYTPRHPDNAAVAALVRDYADEARKSQYSGSRE